MRELQTVLALADRDDATARAILDDLGPVRARELLDALSAYELAQRRGRRDTPAAFAVVAAVRALQPLTAYARPAALLVEQVAAAHVRPSVAIAALAPDVHDTAAALLAAVAAATHRTPTSLERVAFVEAVVAAVAAACPTRRGLRRRPTGPVERMLGLTERWAARAVRHPVVTHPELTTWRIDVARTRLTTHLAAAPHPGAEATLDHRAPGDVRI